MSSVAESEPLSLAEQSVGVTEEWEGSDISVGKDECESHTHTHTDTHTHTHTDTHTRTHTQL